MRTLEELEVNQHKIGEQKKDEKGRTFRMVDGRKIYQIEEKTQEDIDLNNRINLWRMR